jgi:peptide chain release factor subunit 1
MSPSHSLADRIPQSRLTRPDLLRHDARTGFIVIDGATSLYGILHGTTREILQDFSVTLPTSHGSGRPSAHFARMHAEARHAFVRKVAELATQTFLKEGRPIITGLLLVVSSDLKQAFMAPGLFDPCLTALLLEVEDIAA